MQIHDSPLQQLIIGLIKPDTERMVDTAIERWEQLATHIISIIGEGGFKSLYARSVHLTQSTFPWLLADSLPPVANLPFAALKASLQGQTTALANEANQLLLITFTDILASLIGAHLTARILHLAWGENGSRFIYKELKND
jgi:hypothetical protein